MEGGRISLVTPKVVGSRRLKHRPHPELATGERRPTARHSPVAGVPSPRLDGERVRVRAERLAASIPPLVPAFSSRAGRIGRRETPVCRQALRGDGAARGPPPHLELATGGPTHRAPVAGTLVSGAKRSSASALLEARGGLGIAFFISPACNPLKSPDSWK